MLDTKFLNGNQLALLKVNKGYSMVSWLSIDTTLIVLWNVLLFVIVDYYCDIFGQ